MKATGESVSDLLFPAAYRRKALALLLLHPERRMHLREIARITATAPGTMARELDRLHRAGLLDRTRAGNQILFSANRGHPVHAELESLLRKTVGLADVLADALGDLADRIDVAFVFGSVARGADHAGSDVDVMVIGEAAFVDVALALHAAQERLQREVNPKVYTMEEWRAKVREGSSFVADVLARPKIFLIGSERELGSLGEPREPGPQRAA